MQHVLRVVLVAAGLSCNPADPMPPGDAPMKLEALDASCTEAWLSVAMLEGLQPRAVVLRRDTQVVFSGTVLSSDTTILDEGPLSRGLFPNRSYTYTLTRPTDFYTDQARVTATTMDTTSHSFTWETTLLGDGSSTLYDVAIINDTLAFAVGELFLRDSSGQLDPRRFNLAIWNGISWRIERLMYQGSPPVLRSIVAFGENDVWLDPWFHWNGRTFGQVPIDPIFIGVGVNKMWGSLDGWLYVVGNGGFIAKRSTISLGGAGTWRRLESGTTLPIMDVYGGRIPGTDETEVLCIASNVFMNQGRRVLRIDGTTVTSLLTSLWFRPGRQYYVAGAGVHYTRSVESRPWRVYSPGFVTSYHSSGMGGDAINNVFVVGSFLEIVHFNGVDWYNYRREIPPASGALGGVAVRGNQVIAVGSAAGGAMVLVGRR